MHQDNFKGLQMDTQMKKNIQTFLIDVAKKLSKSATKYGDSSWVNDTKKELNEEIIDVVGWTVLQALRIKHMADVKFAKLDKIYWDQVFKHMSDDQLVFLQHKINKEVNKRGA